MAKKYLAIAALVGIAALFFTNALKVLHWNAIGWNCVSYHPLIIVAAWIAWAAYSFELIYNKHKDTLMVKIVGVMWFVMNMFLLYCLGVTYWGF